MVTSSVDSVLGALYSEHVNPQWVRLLDLLEMNVRYERCLGSELFTEDGRRILDFLSGYCVHNVGHNHAAVIAAIREELESCGPAMIQTHVAERAGELGGSFASAQGVG
jgi:ornithine--oxo-acid transaminase